MSQEIERKFLVKGDFKQHSDSSMRITQGYLSSVPERIVRIRVYGDKAFLTIKGITNSSGISRYEWEKEIAVNEAFELLKLCEPGIIDKTRYLVKSGKNTFEVDEFYGENEGLVVAEIELVDEDQQFEKPDWLGEEVTGDKRYFNSRLVKTPFSRW
jgi:adenylate cyclase